MSIQKMQLAWTQSQSRGSTKLVLLAIADCADTETGTAYPGTAYLMERSRLAKRSVRNAIHELKELGEIEVIERGGYRKGKQPTTNLYRITLEDPELEGKYLPEGFHPNRQDPAESTPTKVQDSDGSTRKKVQDSAGSTPTKVQDSAAETATKVQNPAEKSHEGAADCTHNQQQKKRSTKKEAETEQPANNGDDPRIQELFDYWQAAMEKPAAKLTANRRTKIRTRLEDGYSVDRIKRAIDGCAGSDFHMGREPGQPGQYNDLTLICRNPEKLEQFETMAPAADPGEDSWDAMNRRADKWLEDQKKPWSPPND